MNENPAASTVTGATDGPSFLRKGDVGDWKNHLNAQVIARFHTEVLSKLEGSGLYFEFEA